MMHALVRKLDEKLKEKKVPIPIVEGPESSQSTTFGRERIVIEYDDQGGDRFGPARGTKSNAEALLAVITGAKVSIYARSAAKGPLGTEHRAKALHARDKFLVAMHFATKDLGLFWTPISGRLTVTPDLEASDKHGGALYEMALTIEAPIVNRAWDGSVAGEIAITGPEPEGEETGVVLQTSTQTTLDGETYEEVPDA